MAKIDFNSITFNNGSYDSTTSAPTSSVGFFSLKNDGDEAIVRIMHDSVQDFEILSTHPITLNGKYRTVNCVREARDPVSKCPLCASGTKLNTRLFIRLIQYTMNPDGTVTAEPKVWERSLAYANRLKGYIDNYGPLSDLICKIVRHGKAGDIHTEFEIIPNLSKQIYKDEIFVKDASPFEGYSALGRSVLNKTAEEIAEYLTTGNFPMKQDTTTDTLPTASAPIAPTYSAPQQRSTQQYTQTPVYQQPVFTNPTSAPVIQEAMPWDTGFTAPVSKPVRTY